MKRPTIAQRTPILEWIAAALGMVLLMALLGVIAADALSKTSRQPPAIVIETKAITKAGNGYVIVFEATNRGGGTAAALQIEGQLLDGARIVEASSATIDYLPGHGRVAGGLFYSHNPHGLTVRARPLGYQTP